MAPASRPLETSYLVPGWDAEVLGDLPQEVVDTITSARAPSTRHAYALKWNLFVEWCSSHREDPRRCPIRVVLSFLQQGLERRLSPSTLKVYVAVIAANHDPVEGKSVGKHDWVVRFLRGARRLNPQRPPSIPSWDLSLVLRALQQGPFEPLQTVEPKFLSMKILLLLALASIKRVGDLHAFLVYDSCLQFGPADSQIILRPRPGYVPKCSHYSIQRPGGEPASAAPGGGRPSPGFALSRPSIEILRWQDAKLQDLRPALCLSRWPAER